MTKDHVIKIPKTQIVMAFVATCIETTARFLNVSYKEIFTRMKKVGMIENYIFKNYETLHTQSREYIAEDMVECLKNWEARQ
ncbi:MAG: DUF3791 domain-containing protein [Bacteroidales bacterium]|nr:DUF3791 domain-containing protein [Bacteroidales bacterium]MBQ5540277.1 DUF3791 domain-containing protein [Bacteroidales bacterium]MBR4676921.1 DUF3791 domain-containing protein [Bacteroidales bacterium]